MEDSTPKSKLNTTIKDNQEQRFQSNVQEAVAATSSRNANVKEDNDDGELEEGEIEASKKTKTICPYCGREFNNSRAFGGHVRTHPQHKLQSKPKPKRKFSGPSMARDPGVYPKLVKRKVKGMEGSSSSFGKNRGCKIDGASVVQQAANEGCKNDQVGSGSGLGLGLGSGLGRVGLYGVLAGARLRWGERRKRGQCGQKSEALSSTTNKNDNEGCSKDDDGEPRRANVDIGIDLNRRPVIDLNEMPEDDDEEQGAEVNVNPNPDNDRM